MHSAFTKLRQDGHGDTERAYLQHFVANAQKKMDTLPGINSLNPRPLDCKKEFTVYSITQSNIKRTNVVEYPKHGKLTSWLHRSSTILNPLLLPTDAHNVKNAELLKHSKLDKTLQHVSVYIETIFRELKSVLG